jgi:large subunit ribosomal protein L10
MASRNEKLAVVEEITAKLNRAVSVVLADYRGLNVAKATELRRRLRQAKLEYVVVKNTLTRRALEKAGLPPLDAYLTGPTALAFGYDDPAAPAKVLIEFARENRLFELKGGLVAGRVCTGPQIREIANLPARSVLLAMVVGQMQWPLTGLVSVLAAPMRGLVRALDAVSKQRAEASVAAQEQPIAG